MNGCLFLLTTQTVTNHCIQHFIYRLAKDMSDSLSSPTADSIPLLNNNADHSGAVTAVGADGGHAKSALISPNGTTKSAIRNTIIAGLTFVLAAVVVMVLLFFFANPSRHNPDQPTLIKPKRLVKGDTAVLVSPASAYSQHVQNATAYVEEIDYVLNFYFGVKVR
jgi:hypothetical protein